MQRWPEFFVAPVTASSTAFFRSSSSKSFKTIRGSLPPNSKTVLLYPACSAIYFPTPTLPVNVIKSILDFESFLIQYHQASQ